MAADLMCCWNFDAKYLGGFYCISRRLTLLFVITINIVVDIKRHADLDVIDNFLLPIFLARIFFYLFIYRVLFVGIRTQHREHHRWEGSDVSGGL